MGKILVKKTKNIITDVSPIDVEYILKNKHLSYLDLSWEEIQKLSYSDHPLTYKTDKPEEDLINIIRNPKYFHFTCKYIFNIDLHPFQVLILQQMWGKPFPMLIGSRGLSKSFCLAVFILLYCLIHQGRKVAITGAVFRQSKVIFEYMEKIWDNAPVLRDLVGGTNNNGAKHGVDQWTFKLGDSLASAYPIGDGSKIRGQRANLLVIDEFSSLSPEVYEVVISGFAAVSANPIESIKREAEIKTLKALGIWTDEHEQYMEDNKQGNQSILSGTAYYAFNHFFTYFKKYKSIIESKGDKNKLEEIFNGDVPSGFSHKDFLIIRIPIELVPEGFMDSAQIARSQATTHSGIFMMEFGACTKEDTEIITPCGLKQIKDLRIGDYVLTHMGRFRKITNTFKRKYKDNLVSFKTYGNNQKIDFTPEHPFWVGEENWSYAKDVEKSLYLPNFNEINNLSEIFLSDYCQNYLSTTIGKKQYLYAKPSSFKYETRDKHIKYKSCVPNKIKLDYNFGMILGYYASEGSGGSQGKSVSFAMDGHKDINLKYYIKELSLAIKKTFDRKPSFYKKKKNTLEVNINNRLINELIKSICPGVAHTKKVDSKILFSNPELMRGFLVGYWHGDRCLHNKKQKMGLAKCVNKNLLMQVRLCLSYFGISSALNNCKTNKTCQFRGKTYNNKPTYSLQINGDNFNKFVDLVNNSLLPEYKYSRSQIINDNEKSIFNIISKENYYYDGYVYNLEVEEDNSYCTINSAVHNCFAADSNGFFKRSLIESCVCNEQNAISRSGGLVKFRAMTKGSMNGRYVYAVDPASEHDNFSIVVLELHEDHSRIVYCWTCTREKHRQVFKNKLTTEEDFYGFCSRKIRELMKVFPCEHISLDSQGGGVAVMEALHDSKNLQPGELPIWPITADHPFSDKKERDCDGEAGLHIVELVNFSKAEYVSEANHGMRKDFEHRELLFPLFDPLEITFATEKDAKEGRVYDTLEDCVMEIEELKDELATIEHTQTSATGRDHWDTPEIKKAGNKKGRMRKDRYSALLMANMAARRMQRTPAVPEYRSVGGFVGKIEKAHSKQLYTGPAWFTQAMSNASYGGIVNRTTKDEHQQNGVYDNIYNRYNSLSKIN